MRWIACLLSLALSGSLCAATLSAHCELIIRESNGNSVVTLPMVDVLFAYSQ